MAKSFSSLMFKSCMCSNISMKKNSTSCINGIKKHGWLEFCSKNGWSLTMKWKNQIVGFFSSFKMVHSIFHILGDLELSKIETTFLLPNTTSKIQLMDIRIIGFSNIITIIINSKTPLTMMNEEWWTPTKLTNWWQCTSARLHGLKIIIIIIKIWKLKEGNEKKKDYKKIWTKYLSNARVQGAFKTFFFGLVKLIFLWNCFVKTFQLVVQSFL